MPLSIIRSSIASRSLFMAIWLLFSATERQLIRLWRSESSFWILADSAAMVSDWELCRTELAVWSLGSGRGEIGVNGGWTWKEERIYRITKRKICYQVWHRHGFHSFLDVGVNKLCVESRIVLIDRSSLGKLEDGLVVLNHQHVLWVRAGGRQWLSHRRGRPDKRYQLGKGSS